MLKNISFVRRVISSGINVRSEKLKHRYFVAIGLEPGILFANKYSSSITAVANAHEEELTITTELSDMGLTMGEAQMIAQDRHRWRRDIVALCPTLG